MTRRSLSTTARVRIFNAAGGRCHICEQRIQVGQPWEVEHRIPLALGGADDESNMRPAHTACHAPKTVADLGDIARAKRREAAHLGAKKPSTFRKPPLGYGYDWRKRRYTRLEGK